MKRRDNYTNISSDTMDIYRKVQDLVSEGMLEIVYKGEKGTFGGKKANGYKFLKWQPPSVNGHITQNTTKT